MIGPLSAVARRLGGEPVPTPETLPEGVAVLRSRLGPRIAGLLSGMGRPAAAVTLGRTRPEVCRGCARERVCGGHFTDYFARHGTGELEPV